MYFLFINHIKNIFLLHPNGLSCAHPGVFTPHFGDHRFRQPPKKFHINSTKALLMLWF